MRDLLGSPSLRRTLFTSGLIITGIDLFTFYMPLYGRSIGLSASVIGTILGMQAAAAFAVWLWMPRLSERFGERSVLTASLFVAGVTYLAFPSFENPYLLGPISFMLGLGLGCGQPLSIILTYNDSPPGPGRQCAGDGKHLKPQDGLIILHDRFACSQTTGSLRMIRPNGLPAVIPA